MRLIYAGTPAFAEPPLRALLHAGHEIVLVLTQPDRPAGRGLKLRYSEVKAAAIDLGLPVAQLATLRSEESITTLRGLNADAMIVAAYGLILPPSVLDLFPFGCINIHASLLPRWRGAAPIQRAIMAGDTRTGISIMQMEAGLDTGPVLLAQEVPIPPNATAASLHETLSQVGARCIVDCLSALLRGELRAMPQPEQGATYAAKIQKSESLIDWKRSAQVIDRQVRALNPYPVATTSLHGAPLRVWFTQVERQSSGPPGCVLLAGSDGIVVGCGENAVRLLEMQRPSSKRVTAAEFLRGYSLSPGERLGS
jgi:methionyl-tRNA formyltransferase